MTAFKAAAPQSPGGGEQGGEESVSFIPKFSLVDLFSLTKRRRSFV